jgi:ribosome-binding ATPase YchF (GTP1/OBG family)
MLARVIERLEKGILRTEGRDYVIKDGDLVLIRFNV